MTTKPSSDTTILMTFDRLQMTLLSRCSLSLCSVVLFAFLHFSLSLSSTPLSLTSPSFFFVHFISLFSNLPLAEALKVSFFEYPLIPIILSQSIASVFFSCFILCFLSLSRFLCSYVLLTHLAYFCTNYISFLCIFLLHITLYTLGPLKMVQKGYTNDLKM